MPASSNHKQAWKRQHLTLGQWLSDRLTEVAGSWVFITGFFVFLLVWIAVNLELLFVQRWDPYPFILLNLLLSCLAAIQAPIILMSQNRAAERDRRQAARDYYVNRKAEREIKILQMHLLELKAVISKQPLKSETKRIEDEIREIQRELEELGKGLH